MWLHKQNVQFHKDCGQRCDTTQNGVHNLSPDNWSHNIVGNVSASRETVGVRPASDTQPGCLANIRPVLTTPAHVNQLSDRCQAARQLMEGAVAVRGVKLCCEVLGCGMLTLVCLCDVAKRVRCTLANTRFQPQGCTVVGSMQHCMLCKVIRNLGQSSHFLPKDTVKLRKPHIRTMFLLLCRLQPYRAQTESYPRYIEACRAH